MAYPKLNIPKLSDVIVEQLEKRILDGVLKPGDRLPPERQLAEEFGVSRPAARGDSATGVARPAQQPPGRRHLGDGPAGDRLFRPWEKLLNQHQDLHGDLLEFRRVLEGAARARPPATPADLLRLEHCVDQLQNAYDGGDLAQQAQADVRFHQAVAEASHNVLFAHLSGDLLAMLHRHVKDNIADLFAVGEVAEELRAQHLAIWEAIRDKQPDAAQQAVETHLDFVATTLRTQQRQAERDAKARLRLEQLDLP